MLHKRDKPAAVSFDQVLREELAGIAASRDARRPQKPGAPRRPGQRSVAQAAAGSAQEQAARSQLLGLAFSGGGIRSATFNLGVLQGLANLDLLQKFDYLSTVSGGGYIGSWLAAWIRRNSIADVSERLRTDRSDAPDEQEHSPKEVEFLREFSNYLTPRLGIFSGDTWAMVATYLRNLLLNLTILVFLLGAVLLVPRLLAGLADWAHSAAWLAQAQRFAGIASLLLWAVALVCAGWNLRWAKTDTRARFSTTPWVLATVGIPTMATGLTFSFWLWSLHSAADVVFAVGWLSILPQSPVLWFVLLSCAAALLVFLAAHLADGDRGAGSWLGILVSIPSGALTGLLFYSLRKVLESWSDTPAAAWHVVTFGPPAVVVILLLGGVLHIGLMGADFPDHRREWLGRMGGWFLLFSISWLGLFGIALYGPLLMAWAGGWAQATVSVGWIATTLGGIMAGKSASTGSKDGNRWLEVVGRLAPHIFVLGLLLLISTGLYFALPYLFSPVEAVQAMAAFPSDNEGSALLYRWHWNWSELTLGWGMVWAFAVAALAALFLSWRVDINEFSMHNLYRNRLMRCYLGASNPNRKQQPFTGFDPDDDKIKVGDLDPAAGYSGPYPIINTALNLVAGEKLAWQKRKAASFVFTPKYCGYTLDAETEGYRPSAEYGGGVPLSIAMTISGAAASPNMGYHTSAPLAFLMTIFNVRLGWWLGNPRGSKWQSTGPQPALLYLVNELLGRTTHRSSYIYLSDGGHFENLGIYELARRRCQFIVACDASADPEMNFADLGNAIEKCRTDLGVEIDIDTAQLARLGNTGRSQWHCAVGRIDYGRVAPDAPLGTLVYLKTSLTGEEPTDVEHYAAEHSDFPHQTTADQFFDESQFESYRALGQHVVTSVFEAAGDAGENLGLEALFVHLRHRWYPPSTTSTAFTKHTATYARILEEMRKDPTLAFLDAQVYPEWERLVDTPPASGVAAVARKVPVPHESTLWLPADEAQRRAGFYFCNQVIQLMEDAYVDLNLEEEYDHPDNRGWLNLMRHWSWSGMFISTYAICAGIYGARFQRFCERRLDLRPGEVTLPDFTHPAFPRVENIQALAPHLAAQPLAYRLNFLEATLAGTFAEYSDASLFPLRVVPLQVHTSADARALRFNIGFALLRCPDAGPYQIRYFRVQNHMRKMGLAREALRQMFRTAQTARITLQNTARGLSAEALHAIRRDKGWPEDSSYLEALGTQDAEREFRLLFESVQLEV